MSALVTSTPAGTPSSSATIAGPCDAPAVSQRNTATVWHGAGTVRHQAVRIPPSGHPEGGVAGHNAASTSPARSTFTLVSSAAPAQRQSGPVAAGPPRRALLVVILG